MPSRKAQYAERYKDGWRARKTFGYKDNGEPNRKAFYGKSQREVLDKLSAYEKEIEQGKDAYTKSSALGVWVTTWLKTYKLGKIKAHTYDTYELLANGYIIPRLGNTALDKLKPAAVQGFVNGLSDTLSSSTIRQTVCVLRGALEQAYKNRLIVYNPAASVTLPKADKVRVVGAFTATEQRELLQACVEHRLSALFVFALGTGCRIGEVLALRWDNVDLDSGTVKICESVGEANTQKENAPHKRERIISSTKTEAGNRTIPLTVEVVEALQSHREQQRAEEENAGRAWVNNDLVFCTALGGYLQYRNIARLYNGLRSKAGISELSLHCLRHTFATNAIGAGVDYYYLSRIMGHSQISVTLDMYADYMPDKAAGEIKKLNGLLKMSE